MRTPFLQKNWHRLLIVLLLGTMLITSVMSVKDDSITGDEIIYPPAGYSYLLYHRYDINFEHAPLLKMIVAIPYIFLQPTLEARELNTSSEWEFGKNFFFNTHQNDADLLLFWSRMMMIMLMVGFGLFFYWAIQRWWGKTAGLISLFLYTFSPNIIANGSLASLDFGVMAFMFAATYFFIEWLQKPSWKNTWIAGILFGLAQVSKFTALFLLPLYLLLLIIKLLIRNKSALKQLKTYLTQGICMAVIGIIMIWSVYLLVSYHTSPLLVQQKISEVTAPKTSFAFLEPPLQILNQSPISRPLAIYGMGVMKSYIYNKGPITNFPQYLFGTFNNMGWWYYYLLAYLIKEPLPILLLLFLSAGFFMRKKEMHTHFASLDYRDIALWIMIIGITLLMTMGNLNIGLRYFLPVFPFIYVFIGRSWSALLHSTWKKGYLVIGCFLCIWLVYNNVTIFPFYLANFNELIGGPQNGYHYLIDSNIDWGQDLMHLNTWAKENKVQQLYLDYFGQGDPLYYLKDVHVIPWSVDKGLPQGYFAVSVTYIQTSQQNRNARFTYAPLEQIAPIARIGYSIYVYSLPSE